MIIASQSIRCLIGIFILISCGGCVFSAKSELGHNESKRELVYGIYYVFPYIWVSGESGKTVKAKIVNSYVFKTSDLLFPDGLPKDPNQIYPRLGKREEKAIETVLQAYINAIVARTNTSQLAGNILGRPAVPKINAKILVLNGHTTIARVDADGLIEMDVSVYQAMFRSSLIEGLKEDENFPEFSQAGKTNVVDEKLILQRFFEFKNNVTKSPAHIGIGDFVWGEKNWENLGTFSDTSDRIERKFNGVLYFYLAHEIGHIALSNFATNGSDCISFRRSELEADVYAEILLAAHYLPLRYTDFQGKYEDCMGYHTFFEQAYALGGFDKIQSSNTCAYPSIKTRLELADLVQKNIVDDYVVDPVKEFIQNTQ